MGFTVRLILGSWERTFSGDWVFMEVLGGLESSIVIAEAESYKEVMRLVREKFGVIEEEPVALTFQWPAWMVLPKKQQTPPMEIRYDGDVQLFMALRVESSTESIYVTRGKKLVDRYRDLVRATESDGETIDPVTGISVDISKAVGRRSESPRYVDVNMLKDVACTGSTSAPPPEKKAFGTDQLFTEEEMIYFDELQLNEALECSIDAEISPLSTDDDAGYRLSNVIEIHRILKGKRVRESRRSRKRR